MTVENVSRFVIQATGPATQSAYRFGVLAKNRTTKSEMTVSAVPTLITNKLADTSPPTPDDEAGTAVAATQNMLLNDVSLKLDGMQIPGGIPGPGANGESLGPGGGNPVDQGRTYALTGG